MREGVAGLLRDKTRPAAPPAPGAGDDRPRGRADRSEPPHEATHWSASAMAAAAGTSPSSVLRIWRAHKLRPHRVRTSSCPGPGIRGQAARHRRALPRPAGARGRALGRREAADPGPRPHPAGPAGEAGPVRDDDPRLRAERHDHPVRGLERARRDGGRAVHAAPPPPGVPALPERRRGGRAGRQTRPRHPGQLRHPQAPQGPGLARAAPALDLPLHPDLGLVAERPSSSSRRDPKTGPGDFYWEPSLHADSAGNVQPRVPRLEQAGGVGRQRCRRGGSATRYASAGRIQQTVIVRSGETWWRAIGTAGPASRHPALRHPPPNEVGRMSRTS